MDERERNTFYAARQECREAWDKFVLEVGYALKIDKLCDWLAAALRKLKQRRD